MPFTGPVPNLNPQALNLFLTVSQGQLFADYPLLNKKRATPPLLLLCLSLLNILQPSIMVFFL